MENIEECEHDWKYNFPSIPNKSICHKCCIKAQLNLSTLEWEPLETYIDYNGNQPSDEELLNRWKYTPKDY